MDEPAGLISELRLSSFGRHRSASFGLGPLTIVAGASGSGKSTVLRAYEALARLAGGAELREVFPDPGGCVPESARPDAQGRRGFRIGCTVDAVPDARTGTGADGSVRLDLAVQAEPELRIVGERLTAGGRTLMSTALVDPGLRTVQAAWHTGAGAAAVTRAPLPDDRLATALLPLRVAGSTEGQLRVLAAAERAVVALRSAFSCDPRPPRMRGAVRVADGFLRSDGANLADVLRRMRVECAERHRKLVDVVRLGCAGPVAGLVVEERDGHTAGGPDPAAAARTAGRLTRTVCALVERGAGRAATPVGRLGDGELRYLTLALVLMTGPGVLRVDMPQERSGPAQPLTVLADGFGRDLDGRQLRELMAVALRISGEGHLRLVAELREVEWARGMPGVTVLDLGT